jgi:cysteine desulfuration protein SufE
MDAEELIEVFDLFDDWQDRYRHLIEMGRKLPPMEDRHKNEITKVRGCVSQVWMIAEIDQATTPRITFIADSDAHIVKGLIAILLELYSGRTAVEVLAVDIDGIFKEIGLDQHLSPNRRNGFFSMVGRIRTVAEANRT